MSEEQIDGSYELDTIFREGKMYLNIEDIIGWLKHNQEPFNQEITHDIIKALIRVKNKYTKP